MDALAITGVGMTSSLGFDAVTACAAARAGLSRPEVLDYWVEDPVALEAVPVAGRTLGWYTEGFAEVGRLVQLGLPAVGEALGRARLGPDEAARAAWVVNLASGYYEAQAEALLAETVPPAALERVRPPYEALKPLIEGTLVPRLLERPPPPRNVRLLYHDQAGAATALALAADVLAQGRVRHVVVGGLDALVDLRWLDACDTLGLLKTEARAVGFTPGEAAAFVVVETARSAEERGAPVLGTLGRPAAAREPAHRLHTPPPTGVVLSEVVRLALADAAPGRPVCHADLNGDPARAAEWGRALVRLRPDVEFAETVYPAVSFGETGAASGFVSVALALHAFARGYAAADTTLVWGASDDGLRGAFTLRAAPPARA